ncbi:lipoprotein NlpI [Celerinatantimonas sp. MCCC 1A17872]|uniref:lipoprotein NlpI n=1 Tax=Celerinatantimonas sp. MCCC 1A17872 TaxID=3177514 RepID=UPI0038BFFEA6
MIKTLWAVTAVAFLLTGCATHKPVDYSPKQLVLATPQQTDYESQASFIRLGQLIQSGRFQDDKLSHLYYQRGMVLSKMGLGAMARLDFSRAIHITPDFAQPYNFLGLYYLQDDELDNAYEAFDSSIELDPRFSYAYFARSVALYYGQKYKLAEQDIRRYEAQTPNDPYRVLWRYLIDSKIDELSATARVGAAYKAHQDSRDWGWQLIALFANKITPTQLLEEAKLTKDPAQRAQQLCEAYFYMAKYTQQHGDAFLAHQEFKLALSSNIYEYIEHSLALLELKRYEEAHTQITREL